MRRLLTYLLILAAACGVAAAYIGPKTIYLKPGKIADSRITALLKDSIFPLLKGWGFDVKNGSVWVTERQARRPGEPDSIDFIIFPEDNEYDLFDYGNWRRFHCVMDSFRVYMATQQKSKYIRPANGKTLTYRHNGLIWINENEFEISYLITDSTFIHSRTINWYIRWPFIEEFNLFPDK